MNRELININDDDAHYEALKTIMDNDTCKNSLSFPIGSTVSIQYENGGPWMHRIIKQLDNNDHNGRFYIVRVTKTGRLIMHNTMPICNTPISTEQYVWEQTKKETGQLEDIFTETRPVECGRIFNFIYSRFTEACIT